MAAQDYARPDWKPQHPTLDTLMNTAATIKLFAHNGSNGGLEALIVRAVATDERAYRERERCGGFAGPTEFRSHDIARNVNAHRGHVDKALTNLAGMGYVGCRVLGVGQGLGVEFYWDTMLRAVQA